MKKTFLRLMTVLLSLAFIFSFAACNPGAETGGDGNGNEPSANTVANNQIIETAFGKLLDAGELHLSLDECSFSMGESLLLDIPAISGKFTGDCYIRKTETGYDFVAKLNILVGVTYIEETSSEGDAIEYLENQFLSMEFYYVDSAIYTVETSFTQTVVDNAGYENISSYLTDPDTKDDYIYTDLIEDYSSVDETIGNVEDETSQFVSRVTGDKGFRYANSLNVLIGRLVNLAPVLEQLGLSSFGDFISLFKRAGASLAKLDEGNTVADDNGNKVISAELKLKSLYDNVVGIVNENLDNTIGAALDSLAGKDEKYLQTVIDRLFPEGGLTINEFIAAVEETLGELGIEFSFKAFIDEIQTISGLTTQQIADILNPILKNIAAVSVNPRDGETLYDTLARSAFDMIGVDTLLALIPTNSGEGSDTQTNAESASSALNSSMINAMLKEYLYNPEITIAVLLQSMEMPIMEILNSIEVESADLSFRFAFDSDNRLTALSAGVNIGILMSVETGAQEGEMSPVVPMTVIDLEGAFELAVAYTADDSKFGIPFDTPQVYEYEEAVSLNQNISIEDMFASCMSQEELAQLDGLSWEEIALYMIAESDGYISELDSTAYTVLGIGMTGTSKLLNLKEIPEDCDYLCLALNLDSGVYLVKLQVAGSPEAPQA